jgi:hypothetical protein
VFNPPILLFTAASVVGAPSKFKKHYPNEDPWICGGTLPDGQPCVARLGTKIGENKVIISGQNHQDYEICFSYISLSCIKCGKKRLLQSSTLEDMMGLAFKNTKSSLKIKKDTHLFLKFLKKNPELFKVMPRKRDFFRLNSALKNKLLKKLTEQQKLIYRILCDSGFKTIDEVYEKENFLIKISEETKLGHNNISHIAKDIVEIIKEIYYLDGKLKKIDKTLDNSVGRN